MMTFMPAVSERKYDWEKKQVFVSLWICTFPFISFFVWYVILFALLLL